MSAGLLNVLPALVGSVTITGAVYRECQADGAPTELREWISQPPEWLVIVSDPAHNLPETAALGDGEATSITLAWEHRQDCLLVLDERRARKIAHALGLRTTGVLALIAKAAKAGLVDFDDAIGRLREVDFRISEALVEEVRGRLK